MRFQSSFIQTLLLVPEFHRFGCLKKQVADFTASGEFHPAPKILRMWGVGWIAKGNPTAQIYFLRIYFLL